MGERCRKKPVHPAMLKSYSDFAILNIIYVCKLVHWAKTYVCMYILYMYIYIYKYIYLFLITSNKWVCPQQLPSFTFFALIFCIYVK